MMRSWPHCLSPETQSIVAEEITEGREKRGTLEGKRKEKERGRDDKNTDYGF